MNARVDERRFRNERGVELRAGDLRAVFLPGLGMTGVSLRLGRREFLALPGGVDALRRGGVDKAFLISYTSVDIHQQMPRGVDPRSLLPLYSKDYQVATWKRHMARRKDFWEKEEYDLHGV